MTNATVLFDNYVDRATTIAATTTYDAVSTPSSNIRDVTRSAVWRSTNSSAAVDVDITLNSYETLATTHIAVVDAKYASLIPSIPSTRGSIRVRAWTDALGGATLVYDQYIYPWDEIDALGVAGFDQQNSASTTIFRPRMLWPNLVNVVAIGSTITARFWRFTFGGNADQHQCSRIYLSKGYIFPVNFKQGSQRSFQQYTRSVKNLSGSDYFNSNAIRPQQQRVTFTKLTNTQRDTLLLNLRTQASSAPFVYQLRPDAGGAQKTMSAGYGRQIGEISVEDSNFNASDVSFVIDEVL